ncbi:MAG: S8/S53 family peptidase [Saprospiraceae bacterium]|nr:S8/S53 family peptidase [Saprospiraceae bacterium]
MAFKGKYSHLITDTCGKGNPDLSEIDRDYHLDEDRSNIYSRFYGWIKSNEIILHLSPTTDINLGSLSKNQGDCSQIIRRDRSPVFKDLVGILKSMLKESRVRLKDIKYIKICPHNPRLILVKFEGASDANDEFIQKFVNENGSGTGGGLPKNRSESLPNGSYGPNEDLSIYKGKDLEQIPGRTRSSKPKVRTRVGIVDRGPFSTKEPFYHVDVIKRIIEDDPYVSLVNMPMVEKVDDEATTFDMICALNNKVWLDQVDLINISQGHYAPAPHPLLYETLRCINKVIVCSAGNANFDNDLNGHWPSNLSIHFDHVIAIANIDEKSNFQRDSNYGRKCVTISGIGEFGSQVVGTSYSAAWVSRMIALAYSISGHRDLILTEVVSIIRRIYPVAFNAPDVTLSKIRLLK